MTEWLVEISTNRDVWVVQQRRFRARYTFCLLAAQFLGGFFRALTQCLRLPGIVLIIHMAKYKVFPEAVSCILILITLCVLLLTNLAGCAANAPQAPYPAFVQVEELPETFIAGLPGVRAKQLAGDPKTGSASHQVLLPADWQFTTGASPGKSVEIFVLAGNIGLGDLVLGPGGYAFIPSGSSGLQMKSSRGASLLYFLDDADPGAVIQTPLIMSSDLVRWMPLSENPNDLGLSVKDLRTDPGSGARTWLMKIEPFAVQSWQQSTTTREGYLIAGSYRGNECVNGEAVTGDYVPGGYFQRIPGAVYGGPDAASTDSAIWFLRVSEKESLRTLEGCMPLQIE